MEPPREDELVGGHQSHKALLDSVLQAVRDHDLKHLSEVKDEFNAISENISKCTDSSGNNLAHLAIHKEDATLRFVVEHLGADVNGINVHGKSPLHEAVRQNSIGCCQYLLEKGASEAATTVSHSLSTVFHAAAACGSIECMDLLLSAADNKSEKVNEVDKNKSTALHKCCYDGDIRVTQWLINHGATVDLTDNRGSTPLMVAVNMGRTDIVAYLLEHGADPRALDNQGNCCLHECASRCLPEIAHLLIEKGAEVKVHENTEYNTPLHVAAIHARPEDPEWTKLVFEFIGASVAQGSNLLEAQNSAGKKPVAYVGRKQKDLFTVEAVEKTKENAATEAARVQKEKEDELAARKRELQEKRQAAADKIAQQKEEEERKLREADERARAEDDARYRRDEEAEQKRIEEEEIRKAKAKKAKGKGK